MLLKKGLNQGSLWFCAGLSMACWTEEWMFTGPAVPSNRMSSDHLSLFRPACLHGSCSCWWEVLSLVSQRGLETSRVFAAGCTMDVPFRLRATNKAQRHSTCSSTYPERRDDFSQGDRSCTARPLRRLGIQRKRAPAGTHALVVSTLCTEKKGNDHTRAVTWPTDPALAKVPAGKRRKAPCHLVILSAVEASRSRATPLSAFSGSARCRAKQDWSTVRV